MNQPTRIICFLRRHKWTFVGNSHSKVSVVLCILTSAYGVETFGSRTKKGCLLARYGRYRGWGERLTNRDVRFSPRPRINSLIATYRLLKGLSLLCGVFPPWRSPQDGGGANNSRPPWSFQHPSLGPGTPCSFLNSSPFISQFVR